MIRVAHLLPNLVIGGRERIVADLCREAPRRGIDPLVIAYDPATDPAGQFAVDAPVVAIDRRDPGFVRRLHDWLTDARIDVLHAQGHVSAALARRSLGDTPMVATLHIALGTGWRWAVPVARGLRAARAVTAVSGDLARRYRPLAGQPIRTIATGVDLDRFAAGGTPARQAGPSHSASPPAFTPSNAIRTHWPRCTSCSDAAFHVGWRSRETAPAPPSWLAWHRVSTSGGSARSPTCLAGCRRWMASCWCPIMRAHPLH